MTGGIGPSGIEAAFFMVTFLAELVPANPFLASPEPSPADAAPDRAFGDRVPIAGRRVTDLASAVDGDTLFAFRRWGAPARSVVTDIGDLLAGSRGESANPAAFEHASPPTGGEALPVVAGPPGVDTLYGVVVNKLLPGGLFGPAEDAVVVFEDGTYTSDLGGVFGDGVAASRADEPGHWGHWRSRAGKLELLKPGRDDYAAPAASFVIPPGGADQRLEGCFTSLSGTSFPGPDGDTRSGAYTTVCFSPDGRFSHDRTSYASNPHLMATASGAAAGGRYRIDGHAVRFLYDDGRDEVKSFGFLDGGDAVSLDGFRYRRSGG